MELRNQLDRLDEQRGIITRRNRTKAAMRLMLVTSVVCAGVCLVQNFRDPDGLWYSGFFVSVSLIGSSILILRKQARLLPVKTSAHPSRPRETIEQQLSLVEESLENFRKEIDSCDNAHDSAEWTALVKALDDLPRYLVMNQ